MSEAEGDSLSLGELMTRLGARAHGAALFILALPEAVPLPLPSASGILGVPLALIAGHLAIFGEGSRLPPRAARFRISKRVLQPLSRYLSPALAKLERLSRPRWLRLAARERAIGFVCLYLSILLLLPLPLVNAPPAVLLALLSWGLIQQDGALIALALIGSALLTGALVAVALWAGTVGLPFIFIDPSPGSAAWNV